MSTPDDLPTEMDASNLQLPGFRSELRRLLKAAIKLMAAEDVHSDEWFDLGERLNRACWLVASATHCRNEWPEPTDERPDPDERSEPSDSALGETERWRAMTRRTGRRDVARWSLRLRTR